MKKPLLFLSLCSILISSCSTNIGGKVEPTPTATSSPIIEKDTDLSDDEDVVGIDDIMVIDPVTGKVIIKLNDAQINHLNQYELSQNPDLPIKDLQVLLKEENILIFFTVYAFGIPININLQIEILVDDLGELAFVIDEIKVGFIQLPRFIRDSVSSELKNMLYRKIEEAGGRLVVDGIEKNEGQYEIRFSIVPLTGIDSETTSSNHIVVGKDILVTSHCMEMHQSVCTNSKIRFMNLETFSEVAPELEIIGSVFVMKMNQAQDKLAIASRIGGSWAKVEVYEIINNDTNLVFTLTQNITQISYGFEDFELITSTGAYDTIIQFWDIYTGKEMRDPIFIAEGPNSGLVINHDTKTLFSSNGYGILRWDFSSDTIIPASSSGYYHTFGLFYSPASGVQEFIPHPTNLEISSDGQFLLSYGGGHQTIWDANQLTALDMYETHILRSISGCSKFMPGTPILLLCGNGDSLNIYDIDKHAVIASYQKKGLQEISVSENGRYIGLLLKDEKVIIHDLWQVHPLIETRIDLLPEESLATFSANQHSIAISESGNLHVFDHDLSNKKFVITECQFAYFAMNDKGNKLALGCADGTVKIYDLDGKIFSAELALENEEDGIPTSMVFNPKKDFELFIFYQNGKIIKYDAEQGAVLWENQVNTPSRNMMLGATISPDGKYLAFPFSSSAAFDVGLLKLEGKSPSVFKSKTLQGSQTDMYWQMAFSPNSKLLSFSSMLSSEIFIFDIDKDRIIKTISSEDFGSITSLAFADNDTITLSNCDKFDTSLSQRSLENCDIELWSIEEGKRIGVIEGAHRGTIVKMQPIGSDRFISASLDGEMIIWNFSREHLGDVACSIANREFTEDEWNEFVGTTIVKKPICPDSSSINRFYSQDNHVVPIETWSKVFGQNSAKEEIAIEPINPDLKFNGQIGFDSSIQNEGDGVIIETPAVIQCRNPQNSLEYLNDFLLMVPVFLETSGNQLMHGVNYEIKWENINKDIELTTLLPPGRHNIIIPKSYLEGNVISGLDGKKPKIDITSKSVNKNSQEIQPLENITVEFLSSHTHPNALQNNPNFPMHSIQLIINNRSEFDINPIQIIGIVYDQNGAVVDFLENTQTSNKIVPASTHKIIAARSKSFTGRCVGYSNPSTPYKIRYWLGFTFPVDGSDNLYGTFYDEVIIDPGASR